MRRIAVAGLLASTLLAATSRAEDKADSGTPAASKVSYLAGGSVYVEAGRLEGLAEGDTLQAVSAGRPIARLVVRYVSSHRAVCDTLGALAMPAVGDAVRYRARPVAPPSSDVVVIPRDSSVAAGLPPAATRRPGRLRGRIGGHYLLVSPGAGQGFSQPALDLRVEGTSITGAPVDVAVDIRSHRTFHRTPGIADDGQARVYRFSASVHDASGERRFTVGRQISPSLASVSVFDGGLAEYGGPRWGAGFFSGVQPDPLQFRFSADVVENGGYVTLHGRRDARRWSVTGGGVASFDHGQVDRQFGFLQANYMDRSLSVSLVEEADLYTGWKRGPSGPTVSLTSTFATARAQVTPALSFNAGYDNRRNVRLFRDRETPETEFDDRARQGEWAGTSLDLARHFHLFADARWSDGGWGGAFRSWSASTEAYRLPVLQSDLRWRSTRFDGSLARGWLHSAGLAVRPWGQSRIELSGGTRRSEEGLERLETRMSWEAADLDLGFARRWYALLSFERDHGSGLDDTQTYVSLSWIF